MEEGFRRTIEKQKRQIASLQRENSKLKRELGVLEVNGYIEEPSLPAIVYDFVSPPRCEKHGATLAFDKGYYRCEACKTSMRLVVPLRSE